ncbi:MAG TPA: hypothetical protein HA261_10155 [Methanosarcina sp.]|nr:hypothetical protein [Methanosarcina sp.]
MKVLWKIVNLYEKNNAWKMNGKKVSGVKNKIIEKKRKIGSATEQL